jgi:hypothetical protein
MRLRRFFLPAALLAALLPSAHIAWINRDLPALGNYSSDDGLYWVCAKSIAAGSGYRLLSFPGEPYQTKYPPLYPLLLSLVWKVHPGFPDNLPLAAAVAWLMVPLFIGAAAWFYRRLGFSWAVCCLLCVTLALHPVVVALGTMLLTELPFTALCLVALCLAGRASPAPWASVAAGIIGGLAFLTRTAGIVLLVSVPAAYCLSRRFRDAAAFATAMLPFVMWWVFWASSHRIQAADLLTLYYTDYVRYHFAMVSWQELPLVVWRNLGEFFSAVGSLIWPNPEEQSWLKWACRLPALAAVAGGARLLRASGCLQHAFFAAGFSLLLLVWHYPPTERFLVPLLPLVLAGALTEARHVSNMAVAAFQVGRTSSRTLGAGVLAGLAACSVLALYLAASTYVRYFPRWLENARVRHKDNVATYQWIASHLPEQARLFAHNETVLFLYTGRQATRLIVPTTFYYRYETARAAAFLASFDRLAQPLRVNYLLLTAADDYWGPLPDRGRSALRDAIRRRGLRRLFDTPAGTALYQLHSPEPRSPSR